MLPLEHLVWCNFVWRLLHFVPAAAEGVSCREKKGCSATTMLRPGKHNFQKFSQTPTSVTGCCFLIFQPKTSPKKKCPYLDSKQRFREGTFFFCIICFPPQSMVDFLRMWRLAFRLQDPQATCKLFHQPKHNFSVVGIVEHFVGFLRCHFVRP